MNTLKRSLIILLIALVQFACKKEESTTPINDDPIDDVVLLKSVESPVFLIEYEYYEDNKIKTITRNLSGEIDNIQQFEYVGDTTIEHRTRYYASGEVKVDSIYYYKLDENTTINYYFFDPDVEQWTEDHFTGENCGLTSYNYYEDGVLENFTSVNYIDENCSVEYTHYSADTLYQRTQYIRDDKNYARSSAQLEIWAYGQRGNIIESTRWDQNDSVLVGYTYTSVFEYNGDDYPISETRTYAEYEGVVDVVEYTFEYY